jgi:hypothetical protein
MGLFSLLQVKILALLIHMNMLFVEGLETIPTPLASVIGLILPIAQQATPACPVQGTGSLVSNIEGGLNIVVGVLLSLGITVSVIGIIVGGLMRATAFGNERRIAASNTAITGAVVGIVIVVMAVAAGESIPGWFNGTVC